MCNATCGGCEKCLCESNLFDISIHTTLCEYNSLGWCNCGAIPMPTKLESDVDMLNEHDYPPGRTGPCLVTMLDVLLSGPKVEKVQNIFCSKRSHVLRNSCKSALITAVGDGCVYMDVMPLGYIYLMRVKEHCTPETLHKLAHIAWYTALKYHIDDYDYTLYRDFRVHANVSEKEFRRLEIAFLELINYNLYVSPHEFYTFRSIYFS